MNKDLSTIKTNVSTEVFDTSSSMKSLIGTYANKRYFQILRAANFEIIREDYSFNTVSGTQRYALPSDFGKEIYLNDTTNGRELKRLTLGDLVKQYPNDMTSSGTVERYVIIEDRVMRQPASASTLSVVSSTSPDNSQTVLIRGMNSSGSEISESVSLNGINTQTTTNTYSRLISVSKSSTTAGTVTVKDGASNTLASLAPSEKEALYKIVLLHYVPTGVITIKVPYIIKPAPLTNDNDYPALDIADLIELGAKADAWRYKKQFTKANYYDTLFEKELAEYIYEKENHASGITQFEPTVYNRNDLV